MPTALTADELAPDGAPAACLAALRKAEGAAGGPMERHTVRQFVIAERLAHDAGQAVDRELLLCAAFLHDAGLFDGVASKDEPYVTDGRRLALEVIDPFGWPAERRRLLGDAIEQHHAPTSRAHLGAEVELMRRSDLVDVSVGLINFGLSRGWLRGLMAAVPRAGFYPLILRELAQAARDRPATLPRIFTPPREGKPVG